MSVYTCLKSYASYRVKDQMIYVQFPVEARLVCAGNAHDPGSPSRPRLTETPGANKPRLYGINR
ncbi:MAG TPA: hypothetical protein VGN34_32295 [Ktedonobacteraceae bacterium]